MTSRFALSPLKPSDETTLKGVVSFCARPGVAKNLPRAEFLSVL